MTAFFSVVILLSLLMGCLVNNFKTQLFFSYLFSITILLFMIISGYYKFALVFLICELLSIRLVILSNNNSQKNLFPSFKVYKKDYKKLLVAVVVGILSGQFYLIFKKLGSVDLKSVLMKSSVIYELLMVFGVFIFITTLIKWESDD
jgi:hypothetical protein